MTKKQLAKFLYEKFYDKGGNFIDLSGLDFTTFVDEILAAEVEDYGPIFQKYYNKNNLCS